MPGWPRANRGTVILALLAGGPSIVALGIATVIRLDGLFNDFHVYWYAWRLVGVGRSPYDLDALRALAGGQGDAFLVGQGYSYPPPFALILAPMAVLPLTVAAWLFILPSIGVYMLAVAAWLRRFHRGASTRRLRLAALVAGVAPPVVGSVLDGQVNLYVVALVAAGVAPIAGMVVPGGSADHRAGGHHGTIDRHRTGVRGGLGGGLLLGVAGVLKLVPAVVVVPLWLGGRRRVAGAVIAGIVVPFAIAAILRPDVAGDTGRLAMLVAPDPFITNQSINGFVSRLVIGSHEMAAAFPGAFDPGPVIAVLTAGLAAWTLAVLWQSRGRLAVDPTLGIALVLATATAGAPKTSFWNASLLLVAVALLLVAAPTLELRCFDRVERLGLLAWLVTALAQPVVWLPGRPDPGPGSTVVTLLASLGLYGNLALSWVIAHRLLRAAPGPHAQVEADAPPATAGVHHSPPDPPAREDIPMARIRHESSVTAISWIPSEAIRGLSRIPFDLGVTHYDEIPPDQIEDLEQLRTSDRFREANELRAYIEVEDGRIVDAGYLGGGHIGRTTVRLGPAAIRFPALRMPDIQHAPEVGPSSVRFVQTVGGRMGIPTPHPVKRKPFVQFWPSLAWTTLELTIHADGSAEHRLQGASPFPRHWIYDADGQLVEKSGLVDFDTWFTQSFGDHTPWGAVDSPAVVSAVESAIERQLSNEIMQAGAKPTFRELEAGENLTTQGEAATQVYLILDGMFTVEIDGAEVAEIGPGAVVGERAALEGGKRTATLRATTHARVAEAAPGLLKPMDLDTLAGTRHRTDAD